MKWAYFTLGFLPSVIVVMSMTMAVSDAQVVSRSPRSLSSQDEILMMVPASFSGPGGQTGGTGGVASQNSYLWLMYIRHPSEGERRLLGNDFDGKRFSLVSYQAEPWGGWSRQGSVNLMAARDISYDTKLIGLDNEGMQEYVGLRNAWDDAVKKLKEKESEPK